MRFLIIVGLFYFCIDQVTLQPANEPRPLDAARKKMNFTDLDTDCLELIFDEMTIQDLLSLGKINKRIIVSIVDDYIARRKFAKKPVVLLGPPEVYSWKTMPDWKEMDDHIEVGNYTTVTNFLQQSGHLISNLGIKFYTGYISKDYYSKREMHEIFRLINLHCADTLSTFTILTQIESRNTFQSFTKPFRKVEKLSLEGRYRNVNNFNELFPSVRHLTLKSIYYDQLRLLDHAIPNLEHLTIFHDHRWMMTDAQKFMKLNSHIRSLFFVAEFGLWYLSFFAEELPNLEKFTLSDFGARVEWINDEINNQTFHFEHLKSFSSHTHDYFPWNAVFGDLEELSVDSISSGMNTSRLVDVAIRYKTSLKKVYLYEKLTNDDLERLADTDMNLEELVFKCEDDVKTEHFVKIIENNEQLVKFTIRYFRPDVERGLAVAELKNRFGNSWRIVENDRSIVMERRN